MPEAHSAVHIAQALHPVTAQSVGHAVVAQVATSVVPEHAWPPPEAAAWTERVRCRDPAPHVAEHAPQTCQEPTEQSTGQVNVEQLCVAVRIGHCAPPSLAAINTERAMLLRPVPQLVEQDAHSPHALTAQSAGQAVEPQLARSKVRGHAAPRPICGCVMLRVRALAPPSQLCEHRSHALHEATPQFAVGDAVGTGVDGAGEGCRVGAGVGACVGVGVGAASGARVGLSVVVNVG